MSLRNLLPALFVVACVMGCGWKPRGDRAVLPDSSFGGAEIHTREPGTDKTRRLVLPAGENVLVLFDTSYNAKVETAIQVIPDTLMHVLVNLPGPGQQSRLVPAEQRAIIKGTVTAGNTGRPMAGVTVRADYRQPVRSDSLGHFRLVLPGSRHHLWVLHGDRRAHIDTFVAPGESAVVDINTQLVLPSPLLLVLGKMKPEPRWRVPVRDATAGDSGVVRAVEDWIELSERETVDTLAARTFAAFELFGTASRGKWLTAYGRERHVECYAGGPKYRVSESRPCLLYLLHLRGRWVAAGSWREKQNVYVEDMFPAKYRRLLRFGGRHGPDPLEARVKAEVAEWKRRSAESQKSKP